MLASSDRRGWVRRAIALGVASMACASWSDSGLAATGIQFPATSAYHRRNYDPFEQPAPQAGDTSPALEASPAVKAPASAAPTSVAAVLHSHFQQPILQAPEDDPFDRLPTEANSTVMCAFDGTDFQAADFQAAVAPRQPEPLPAPPPKYEHEQSEETAGSTWSAKPVCELTTDIMLPGGLLPKNHWQDRPQQFVPCGEVCGTTRGWPVNTFTWVASCLCHNPLYFEEINLERYGYGCGCYGPCCSTCLQSGVSACHFFGTIPALPWKMAVDCPCECEYALGYYRPGSCPPWRYNCCTQPSCLGALAEGGAATALIFLIP
jgi:hypothetical protein